jgi:hypothetical protein
MVNNDILELLLFQIYNFTKVTGRQITTYEETVLFPVIRTE